MKNKEIAYLMVRVSLSSEGFVTSINEGFEYPDAEVKTPSHNCGASFCNYYCEMKVYENSNNKNSAEVEAAKFKCTKWVIEQATDTDKHWNMIKRHLEKYLN